MRSQLLYLTLLLQASLFQSFAVDNGLARTPPLGWNSWNRFLCNIDEVTILSAARALVDTGLKNLGYEYVIIDDCWHASERVPQTQAPRWDTVAFPSGIKTIADKIHAMGLKFGIYSDAGTHTCGGRFGSLGYENIDAQAYAEWGVDYLKYDNCNNNDLYGNESISYWRYERMAKALNKTRRPITYAMCNWGQDHSWTWASRLANSWRMSGDIGDFFTGYDEGCPCTSLTNCTTFGYRCAVTRILDWAAPIVKYSKPGGWNDLDMLEVGNGNMTRDEYITHFSMWALLKSPLILGNDLTNMDEQTFDIITNKAIIDINQDALGVPASRVWKKAVKSGGDLQLWAGPLEHGATVVAIVNTSPVNQTITFPTPGLLNHVTYAHQIIDLWERDPSSAAWGKQIGQVQSSEASDITLRAHQTRVFKLVPNIEGVLQIQG